MHRKSYIDVKMGSVRVKGFPGVEFNMVFFNRDENCETKKLELFLGGLELLDIALVIGQLLA